MDLHYLDSGGARFLEIQLYLVLKGSIPLELFDLTAKRLIELWPVLNTRMNFMRTSLFPISKNDANGFFKSTRVPVTLQNTTPSLTSPVEERTINSLDLHKLFPKGDGFYDTLYPRVFKIRAAILDDTTVLRFTTQHPFCDANGVHRMVNAYCALLQNRDIPAPDISISLDLPVDENNEKLCGDHQAAEPAALRHAEYFNSGWSYVFKGAFKHRVYGRSGPVRSNKTFLIPTGILNRLAKAAEAAGVRVTKHDLLLAIIHEASMTGSHIPTSPLSPPQFSIVVNFARMLPTQPFFHNPWILVILPPLQPTPLSTSIQNERTLRAAEHVRSTILDARRPCVVKQIMDQQRDVRSEPFVPVHYAAHAPQVSVSSWTHIPLFELEFPSADEEGKLLKPSYAQCSVNLCPLLSLGGLTIDDAVLTWQSEEGMYMQGYIDNKIWNRLEQFRASFY